MYKLCDVHWFMQESCETAPRIGGMTFIISPLATPRKRSGRMLITNNTVYWLVTKLRSAHQLTDFLLVENPPHIKSACIIIHCTWCKFSPVCVIFQFPSLFKTPELSQFILLPTAGYTCTIAHDCMVGLSNVWPHMNSFFVDCHETLPLFYK